jgi:hypothetical protein
MGPGVRRDDSLKNRRFKKKAGLLAKAGCFF